MLSDSYGRTFRYLRLSVTDMCNYRCNYCLPDGMPCDTRHKLSLDHIRLLAKVSADLGIEKIRITGGEPAVRNDLTEIIGILKATPGIKTVALTSNGYSLSKKLDEWLDAGLDQLNISCDSIDPRLFKAITGHDHLQRLLAGIEQAQCSSLQSLKVNTVLLRQHNLPTLSKQIEWAANSGITLRFIELMETGDNKTFFADNHVSAEQIQQQLIGQGWKLLPKVDNSGPAKEYQHPDHSGRIGFIAPYSSGFCDSCNRLRISSAGKLHLCLFGESGFDLMPWLEANDLAGLQQAMQQVLVSKPRQHWLHQNETGATTNLAMLGG